MHDAESTETKAPEALGGRARSLANLRPPWRKGESPNPSGLARDGGSAKEAPIRNKLRERLAKRRALERLVDTWIDAACDGDSAAREQILKRLDPVTDDDAGKGRVVLEGLRLELTPQGAAVTLARTSSAPAEASVVVESESESRTGGSDVGDVGDVGEALPLVAPESP